MILKFAEAEQATAQDYTIWNYYERVISCRTISTTTTDFDTDKKKEQACCNFICIDNRKPKDSYAEMISVTIQRRDGEYHQLLIVLNTKAYLLDDHGQTIEVLFR